jgi:hypothetical protein
MSNTNDKIQDDSKKENFKRYQTTLPLDKAKELDNYLESAGLNEAAYIRVLILADLRQPKLPL